MKLFLRLAIFLLLFCASAALAQGTSPSLAVAPIGTLVVTRGGKVPLNIALQVNRGFHVNSNKPNDELLLPTVLHLFPPQGVMIVNIQYPAGEDLSVPMIGNEKLNVYTGNFEIAAVVRTQKSVALGTQRVHGDVRYQACNNRQCFPPKTTPLEFDIKVVRPKVKKSTYTAASPHIH